MPLAKILIPEDEVPQAPSEKGVSYARVFAPFGVVSLLDMLEFYARGYLELTHRFGMVLGYGNAPDPDVVKDAWTMLFEETARLDLPVTREHLSYLLLELVKDNPTKVSTDSSNFVVVGASLSIERMRHHVEAIYNSLRAEVGSLKLRVIPREKSKYSDPNWLADTPLFRKFPDAVDEFQRAGRCFAYDENVACVFHLMRVTDFCLRKVADSVPVTYDARNWQGIGQAITKEMEKKYHAKTDEWKAKEPFYAEILADIQAIGRGHRNPALHELEKKYDEREARYMLTIIESFASRVAQKL